MVLLDGLAGTSDAVLVAERIQQRLSEPFMLQGHEVVISASIGVTVVDRCLRPHRGCAARRRRRDVPGQGLGKGRHATFDDQLHDEAHVPARLENDLRRALHEGQLWLAYEPIVAADSARILGFEALLRWRTPRDAA